MIKISIVKHGNIGLTVIRWLFPTLISNALYEFVTFDFIVMLLIVKSFNIFIYRLLWFFPNLSYTCWFMITQNLGKIRPLLSKK